MIGNSLTQSSSTETLKQKVKVTLIFVWVGFPVVAEAEFRFDLQGVFGD